LIYRKFQNRKLPWLGMGAMRLPCGADGAIDEAEAQRMIDSAMAAGVNYFDTSYFYHGGDSESFLRRALGRHPRGAWLLADKMPGNMMRKIDGGIEVSGMNMPPRTIAHPREIFEYQLDRCGVDFFDFYMLHNVSETTFAIYTDKDVGMVDYLLGEKKAGRIKHLGFSAHGRPETIKAFLEYLRERGDLERAAEFAMIQINYLDFTLQEAGKKYDILTEFGVPVFVMEPVRGGRLCNLPKTAADILAAARPDLTQAQWAFKYLQTFPNIAVVVSGMTTQEQLKENIDIFRVDEPLRAADLAVLDRVVGGLANLSPCTDCKYCLDICPVDLDIPKLLAMHNEAGYEVSWTLRNTLRGLDAARLPGNCTGCGACNPLCPQNIDIPAVLGRFADLIK